jgi:hypothetical protein
MADVMLLQPGGKMVLRFEINRESSKKQEEDMMPDFNEIKHVSNPLVEMMYLKREFNEKGEDSGENILVVKLKSGLHLGTVKERQEGLNNFLANLDLLRDEIERKAGKFKRIDIQGSKLH